MTNFLFSLGLLILSASFCAHAQHLPGGVKLNPAFKTETLESHPEAQAGIAWRGIVDKIEISIKNTKLANSSDAQNLTQVEYANVYHLYDERGNPYQGQISQLIICDKKFTPKIKTLEVLGKKVRALVAGATERKVLGACNADQVANWAEYFNFVAPDGLSVLSVRLFRPVSAKDHKELALATDQLGKLAEKLIVRDKL